MSDDGTRQTPEDAHSAGWRNVQGHAGRDHSHAGGQGRTGKWDWSHDPLLGAEDISLIEAEATGKVHSLTAPRVFVMDEDYRANARRNRERVAAEKKDEPAWVKVSVSGRGHFGWATGD